MNSLFDNTIQLLTKAIDYTTLRHNVIASNIANVDTPGYKAMDLFWALKPSYAQNTELKFEHLFKRARKLREGKANQSSSGFDMQATQGEGLKDNQPMLVLDTTGQPRLDGNTVNPDQQLAKLAENTIMHNTFVQLLNMRFKMLHEAISFKG